MGRKALTPLSKVILLLLTATFFMSSALPDAQAQLLPTISIQGAAFCTPESMRDDISQYTAEIPEEVGKTLPLPIPSTGFLLATRETLSLVLADHCDKGVAAVEGWTLPRGIELSGVSLNVILAEKVSFNKEGKPVTVREILSNPKNYELELVKVLAFRRQISVLYDPDDGSEVEVQVTTGYVTEEREKVPELMRGVIRKGGDLIRDPSRSLVKDLLRTERSRLPFFDFEHEYWMDSQAETNGIVLVPDAPILDLLRRVVPIIGELIGLEELPVLYDVKKSLVYEEVSSVGEVNRDPEEYVGKVIGLSADGLGGGISIQESIKAATGEETEADVRLEGLEAWNTLSVPPRKEELLTAVGASNTHQDEAFSRIDGEFEYIGRVISTKQIDESLPAEVLALVVYQRQKIGEIDYERLQPVEEEIEDKLEELYFVLTSFMEEQPPTPTPTPTHTSTRWESTGTSERVEISDYDYAVLEIKNTGDVEATFYVGYEISPEAEPHLDVSPPKQVTLAPGSSKETSFRVKNLGTNKEIYGDITFVVTDPLAIYEKRVTLPFKLVVAEGKLIVYTDGEEPPNSGQIYVNNEPVKRNAGTTYEWRVAAGEYAVAFGDIKGFITPSPQTVYIDVGETETVVGRYTEAPTPTPTPAPPPPIPIGYIAAVIALAVLAVVIIALYHRRKG